MTTVIALLGRAAAEALFYMLVAGWYLLCVQWDVIDVLLGGPDLNRVTSGKLLLVLQWFPRSKVDMCQGSCNLIARRPDCACCSFQVHDRSAYPRRQSIVIRHHNLCASLLTTGFAAACGLQTRAGSGGGRPGGGAVVVKGQGATEEWCWQAASGGCGSAGGGADSRGHCSKCSGAGRRRRLL
jgi:hypothetical protein